MKFLKVIYYIVLTFLAVVALLLIIIVPAVVIVYDEIKKDCGGSKETKNDFSDAEYCI